MVLLEILGEVKRGGKGKGRWRLAHDRELCTLCGGCPPLCPEDALTVYETYLDIDRQKCTACGACAPGCPTGALRLTDGEEGRAQNGQLASSPARRGDNAARDLNDTSRNGRTPVFPRPSSRNDSMERGPI